MSFGRELAFGLVGAWRLIRNDPGGLQFFDRTPAGALRSFRVMLLAAPADAVLTLLQLDALGMASIGLREILLWLGFYVVSWLLFPLIVLRLAPTLGRTQEAPGFVCANNWAQIIRYALVLFVGALAGLLAPPLVRPVGLVLIGLLALIDYRLLRHALTVAPPQAALFVVLYMSTRVALDAVFFTLVAPDLALA